MSDQRTATSVSVGGLVREATWSNVWRAVYAAVPDIGGVRWPLDALTDPLRSAVCQAVMGALCREVEGAR